MEHIAAESAEGSASPSTWTWWPWILLAVLVWHGWMSWCLLGKEALCNEEPILSGLHPQHLYLGYLGAQALHTRGQSCCFDPAFQIGFPKTPVFNGSRLAEVFLFMAGGTYHPMAYKIGLLIVCALVPCLIILAACAIGMDWPATTLATAASLIVWWSPFSCQAMQAGASELLLGSLAVLAHTGLLIGFHRRPGALTWLGLTATGWLGWFAQPMLCPIGTVIFLVYYIHVGHRHSSMFWHVFLLLAEVVSLVLNATWMIDWVMFWWLRAPLPTGTLLQHRTFETFWNASLWGEPTDRGMGLFLLASSAVGLILLPRGQRTAARLLALGTIGLFVLAILGIGWEPLGALGTAGLLAPALWFASLPAAQAWVRAFRGLQRIVGGPWRAALLLLIAAGVPAVLFHEELTPFAERFLGVEPLPHTLGPEREALIQAIRTHTSTDARILWEDMARPLTAVRWTPLLPVLTGRSFVGGLDPDVTFFHATIGLANQRLQERPIRDWSDENLDDYCTHYNIGWTVCFSPDTIQRFEAWGKAEKTALVKDGDMSGVLFTIKRPTLSFALRGQAQVVHADSRYIELANVVPDNGVVVLSLHYQAGMRASPGRVSIDCELSDLDPIGFMRLRMAGPAARVTLTWGE